jgi:hypothetical protein
MVRDGSVSGPGRSYGDLVGPPVPRMPYDERFRKPMAWCSLAFHLPPDTSGAPVDPDPDRDVGRLFVGSKNGVDVFDLTKGERKLLPPKGAIAPIGGLAVTDDGTRVFAGASGRVLMFETGTGAMTEVLSTAGLRGFRWAHGIGCVIDNATQSLVISDYLSARALARSACVAPLLLCRAIPVLTVLFVSLMRRLDGRNASEGQRLRASGLLRGLFPLCQTSAVCADARLCQVCAQIRPHG